MSWFTPRLGESWLVGIERYAASLSRRKGMVLCIFLIAIAARLALLWAMPIPLPSFHDEFSHLLAGDTFAHFRLSNPPHPMWIFFDTFHILSHPTYSSIYPPAPGIALAVGEILGHPWIGVLLSMSAMCAAVTWALQGWMPPQWAMVGALIAILRIHLFNYWLEGYWGGAMAAIGGALVIGALPRLMRRPHARYSLLMGLGVFLMANSRPFEGLIFCLPVAGIILVWLLSSKSPPRNVAWAEIVLPFLFVFGGTIAFIFYYNWRVTNHILMVPHVLYDEQYINYRVFVWQKLKPPLQYANPQFQQYFNFFVRHPPHGRGPLSESNVFFQFFIGRALSIPLLACPLLLRDRRIRLPLVQFVLCFIGFFTIAVGFWPHYAAPVTATFIILLVQCIRHLRRWELKGRPIGIFLTRLVFVLLLLRAGALTAEAYRHPLLNWSVDRARIVKELENTPCKHLVIVRYAPDHFVHHEWVYNGADIDCSKTVWAREIPGMDMTPLLNYFRDRRVWLLQADQKPPQLEEYPGSPPERSGHGENLQ